MFPGRITVIGAGSWGTALAVLLCRNFDEVCLWGRNPDAMESLSRERCNQRYLPGINLPDNLHVTSNLEQARNESNTYVVVVPSHVFRPMLLELKSVLEQSTDSSQPATLVWGTKGFDHDSGKLLSEVAAEIFPTAQLGIVSGPSFATETARGLPTALTLASNNSAGAEILASWFRTSSTRVYYNDDLVGVQLGGAIKNVMAIAAGISDGLKYGANARAALITRGLSELTRLGIALGGKAETFMGLTGVGDLILTCTDNQSRNRRFGLGLGAGKTTSAIKKEIGQEIEGINTARELYRISRNHNVDMPITEQVYRIIYEGADPSKAVQVLIQRDPKAESH
jgi:glycerol-3-phosphate dehydrogenase (NAD(P)+)